MHFKGQEVDATYVGNKTRFINNADKKFSNCTPKILLCNTVLRTGLFASKNLKAGTELFFDYYYPEEKYYKCSKQVKICQTKPSRCHCAIVLKIRAERYQLMARQYARRLFGFNHYAFWGYSKRYIGSQIRTGFMWISRKGCHQKCACLSRFSPIQNYEISTEIF